MQTTEKLALALEAAGVPDNMVANARAGHYDDFKSDLDTPCIQLVTDLTSLGFTDLANRAKNGGFDATLEDSNAWAESDEGKEVFKQLFNNKQES